MMKKRLVAGIAAWSICMGMMLPCMQTVGAEPISTAGGYSVQSLLPLNEQNACIVLDREKYPDLHAVPADAVIDHLLDSSGNAVTFPDDQKIVWSYYKDAEHNVISDDFFVLDRSDTLDLSLLESDQYKLEMIVGDGNQLNAQNTRYIVTVYLSDELAELRTYELYTQDADGTRHPVQTTSVYDHGGTDLGTLHYSERTFVVQDNPDGTEYYLGIHSLMDEHPFIRLDVLNFNEYANYSQTEAAGLNYEYSTLNDMVLNQDMRKENMGLCSEFSANTKDPMQNLINNLLFLVYVNEKTGEVLASEGMMFYVSDNAAFFTEKALDADGSNIMLTSETGIEEISDIRIVGGKLQSNTITKKTIWLKEGYSPDAEYKFQLDAHSPIWDNANAHVVKAVSGIYRTLEEAEQAKDIKTQLIPETGQSVGYSANYSAGKEGQTFSVFFDDETSFWFQVEFKEYDPAMDKDYIREYSEVPIVGEQDPWFRVTGALDTDGHSLDSYIVENGKNNNIDTMYGYGYQAVFLNGDVSAFVPQFWTVNSEQISVDTIYVNGSRFDAGSTLQFPANENVLNAMFSVIIRDSAGKHTKNYNVSFLKKASGAQLFVAGPKAPETRSVFLDEYFEYKHDIFLANLGDIPLTDLRIELDAENVKLDPYWTIGGNGNDTLQPCPEHFREEQNATKYGELSNTAKIRLIPDGASGGEISGSLKVYSGDTVLAELNLSGRAQNPKINTDSIGDAVQYVPYSYLITTNNMYDWTTVNFTLSGDLPDGMTFYPETGEIYGVPTETGAFPFSVTAEFTSDTYSFEGSSRSFTLTVQDNTNENVFRATDEDYILLDPIGVDQGNYDFVLEEYKDEVFRSEGVLDQFVGLWLNGERLTEGTDYFAESGSTKLTVYAQTFEKKAEQSGVNTIAMEFRTADSNQLNTSENTNELRRTAQNFRIGAVEAEDSNEVTCAIRLYDAAGGLMKNAVLELRSTPQTKQTDSNGVASFEPIEFGAHTLSLINEKNEAAAILSFRLESGSAFSVSNNTVTAIKGSRITLDAEYDGSTLRFRSPKSSSGSSTAGEGSSKESNSEKQTASDQTGPKTGEQSDVMFYLMTVAAAAIVMLFTGKRSLFVKK